MLIYINHQYIFNKISFINIEINSLLKIMIYKSKPYSLAVFSYEILAHS